MLTCCSGGDEVGERFVIGLEDGVAVALTRGGALYEGNIFALEPILTLKEDPQREESLLYRAGEFTLGPDGNYYVIDRGNGRIAVFDAAGNYVRSFGRRGSGPGEFDSMGLQALEGNVLSIFDFQSQRTTLFRTDGELLDVIRLRGGGLLIGLNRAPGGELITRDVESRREDRVGWVSQVVTVLAAGETDTLAVVTSGMVAENMLEQIDMPDGTVSTLSTDMPYSGHPTAIYVPDRGILVTEGTRPELRWYDLAGSLTRVIRIELPERPVTEAIRSSYEERLRRRRAEAAARRGREPRPVRGLKYPDTIGLFGWAMVDDAGYIWLTDVWSSWERSDEEGWTFHVVDPEGRYLGVAELPVSRGRIRGGRLMGTVTEPDTQALMPTVFRIRPLVEGLSYP